MQLSLYDIQSGYKQLRPCLWSHCLWLSLTGKQWVIIWACYYGPKQRKWQSSASSPVVRWSALSRCIPENHGWDEPWSLSTNQSLLAVDTQSLTAIHSGLQRHNRPQLCCSQKKGGKPAHKRHTSNIPRPSHMFNHQTACPLYPGEKGHLVESQRSRPVKYNMWWSGTGVQP